MTVMARIGSVLLDGFARYQTFLLGLRDLVAHQDGAVATEYALILFFIAVALVAAVAAFGTALVALFQQANSSIP
jgi:Flp pilus assembly pilin Flp